MSPTYYIGDVEYAWAATNMPPALCERVGVTSRTASEGLDTSADLSNERLLEKALLYGAGDWRQYSEGGCALVYDADIAARLCSPSELKRVRGGERQPNSRETWLECQSRALWQAHRLIETEWRKLKGGAL